MVYPLTDMMQEYRINLRYLQMLIQLPLILKIFLSSFVDRNVDHCIIPPNSFALAKTVGILKYLKKPWLYASENQHMLDAELS